MKSIVSRLGSFTSIPAGTGAKDRIQSRSLQRFKRNFGQITLARESKYKGDSND